MSEPRYHVYGVRAALGQRPAPQDDGLKLLASADQDGIGVALVTLAAEGTLDGLAVGVLDRGEDERTGTWIINPYGANSESLSRVIARRTERTTIRT